MSDKAPGGEVLRHCLAAVASAAWFLSPSPAACDPATDRLSVTIELVLAVDTSISVDDAEYLLQMKGIADAFRSAEVATIISNLPDGAAVTIVHWSYGPYIRQATPWRHLTDEISARTFADEIEQSSRSGFGRSTSIGDAIDYSAKLIEENGFHGTLRKIDISGDERSNSGASPVHARDRAIRKSITINGLTMETGDYGLYDYYRDNVAGGPGSFVLQLNRFEDFSKAMQVKLERELTVVRR